MTARLLLVVASLVPLALASVPVDIYVMSKCPDAAACESAFVPALKKLGDAAKVTFHYIGSGKDGNFNCMHGPEECVGDIQQLCVQASATRDQLLDFVLCQDNSQIDIPRNGEACAKRAGLDWTAISACVNGDEGSKLMTESLASSTQKGIGVSCTVQLDDMPFCVHNGGWTDCSVCGAEDKGQCLIKNVCDKLPRSEQPEVCSA